MDIRSTCLLTPKAAWNVALTQADIEAIQQGLSPTLIRPENLTYFRPERGA